MGSSSGAAQTDFVTKAVHNAALTCYAVEGAYPTDLEYLRTLPGCMPLRALLGIVDGPVTVRVNGADRQFSSFQECESALGNRYEVKGISGARIEVKQSR